MRKKAGLSQRALAARLGREQNFVARIEIGERRLDLIEFITYCEACETSAPQEARKLLSELSQIKE